MKDSILIVTHQRGFEADPVIDNLRNRNKGVFRFNSDSGEGRSIATFSSRDGGIELVCDNKRIAESDISVGWCQQLPPYLGQPSTSQESLQRENLLTLQLAIFNHLEIPWLNKPADVLNAANKVNQIIAAQLIGLNVPQTLVSNDPESIRSFASKQLVVAKNLATPWITSKEETHAAFTKIVDSSWLSHEPDLSFAPVIYQEFHERRKDFRVVVVADDYFAAACTPESHQYEDVRRGEATGDSYVACDFDKGILQKLRSLMNRLSLNYCAADFMEAENGDIYFLELNTCGAWWWLDRLYDGDICRSITNTLIKLAH